MGRAGDINHCVGARLSRALTLRPLLRQSRKRHSRPASKVKDLRGLPFPNGTRLNDSVDVMRRSSIR
eukprot:15396450-Alexandrium_andersonii.AAC.1